MKFNIKEVHALLRASRVKLFVKHYSSSKVPKEPVQTAFDKGRLPKPTKIDQKTIEHLERLSLVDFGNKAGIERLEAAIKLADQIRTINTADVEPMVTPLEDRVLFLRKDEVCDGKCRKDIMSNASITEEEYFVAPQGNIPLSPRPNLLEEEVVSKTVMDKKS